ncbi:MAG: hypothetical protein OXL41_11595 [Nitrospinae bacterium]|nr:hypothetical protein [Nitrospinota bacterium]
MDNNTLAIVISIVAVGVGVGVGIIGVMITLIRQGGRHDADIANLRASQEALRTELLTEIRAQREETREEIRALGDRIENRINLDERVRAVEQRTPAAGD